MFVIFQNPDFKSSSIVSLSLPELTGKLKDGELEPDAVLYAFMEKVVTSLQLCLYVSRFFHLQFMLN